jgi:hypothetical protein
MPPVNPAADSLAPWSTVLIEKLLVAQVVKTVPLFYENGRIIIVFTKACHWYISWATWISTALSCHVCLRTEPLGYPHLRVGLLRDVFLIGFRADTFYAFLILPLHAVRPAHRIFLELMIITSVIFVEEYTLWSSSLYSFSPFYC